MIGSFAINVASASYAKGPLDRALGGLSEDLAHCKSEKHYFCFGEIYEGILTVRFTYRGGVVRIFGPGYWRKGKAIYEREN